MRAFPIFRPVFAILAALFLVNIAAGQGIPKRVCGTEQPSRELKDAHMRLHEDRPRIRGRQASNTNTTPISVRTFFHVVSTTDQQKYVNQSMVYAQFSALSEAYMPYGINFRFGGLDYSVNDSWATDVNGADMKTQLRQGTYADLNIYLQTNLSSPAYPGGSGSTMLLGYCSLPATWVTPRMNPSYFAQDGCNILAGSVPGGNVYGYTQGKTAVHEVGHWFGLLHTFQDQSCDPASAGDMIADTPQQSTPTNGCPKGKDSCPASPGLDAVNNYMDYSIDACYTGFTAQQAARMQSMFTMYRSGK